MNKPNVLILVDPEDAQELGKSPAESENWNVFWHVIDYAQLRARIERIREQVKRNSIDFVMYSRDDQVDGRWSIGPVTRALRIGYSSFSGIDREHWRNQTGYCFRDFMECNALLKFEGGKIEPVDTDTSKTFSVIFDTEQLGGVRYGLPRILRVLRTHRTTGTFFVTNLMKKVYPDVCVIIRRQGHEIGIHGMWHEYLSDFSQPEQTKLVRDMVNDLGGPVSGANFMYRMNEGTLTALLENGIDYFVHPSMNYYRFAGYPKLPTTPTLLKVSDGKIWMLPVSVETYGSPWISIKNKLDSAILQASRCKEMHVSVLCHPFRDGNLSHIQTMNRMLGYLVSKGLRPITLAELVRHRRESLDDTIVALKRRLFDERRRRIVLPSTRQDLLGILPENLCEIYRLVMKGRTVF